MVVILHNIRSLYNVGSIFRTADAAGMEKIYLCGITPKPIDIFGRPREQLAKVSLAAEKYVEWEHCKSTSRLIDKLKKGGYKIFSIEQSKNSIPYHKIKTNLATARCSKQEQKEIIKKQNKLIFATARCSNKKINKKIVLVLGNEVEGLPQSILKKSNKILEIPMKGKKESLNVGVAFGIVAFWLIDN